MEESRDIGIVGEGAKGPEKAVRDFVTDRDDGDWEESGREGVADR